MPWLTRCISSFAFDDPLSRRKGERKRIKKKNAELVREKKRKSESVPRLVPRPDPLSDF